MTRVCEFEYPKGHSRFQRKDGFYMDENLKAQIDILIKNIIDDWDFTIIITGGGEVRVGKSVLAMQIAAYWINEINKKYNKGLILNIQDNLVFDGRKLIQKGNELGTKSPYSCLIFDEAGADLEGVKAMQSITQDVLDYYRECGQYNMLNILVLPDFFTLPKGIALTRSLFLLDVYYTADEEGKFQRGYFKFYSKRNKKQLYLKGKRELNYDAHHYNFTGRFYPFYPVDEQEYRKAKQEALRRRENKKRNKFHIQRDASWFLLHHEGLTCSCGENVRLTQKQLGQRMEQLTGIFVPGSTLSDGIRHFLIEGER